MSDWHPEADELVELALGEADEVAAVDAPGQLVFTAEDVLRRVEDQGDLWAEILDSALAAPLPAGESGAPGDDVVGCSP